jgi:hypothetical protein
VPKTWKQAVVRLGFMTGKPFVDAATTLWLARDAG